MINSKFTVTKAHKSSHSKPLFVNKNERIWVGKESSETPGWVLCKIKASNKEGLLPSQIIAISADGHTGTATEDYSARELTVKPGDKVESNRKLNGWAWCVNEDGEAGWLPLEILT